MFMMCQMYRIEKKLNLCLQNKDYYEAHQIYRTLYNRMSSKGEWRELLDMLYSGVLQFLEGKESSSAIDLAELFAETLEKSKTPVTSDILDRYEELFICLPAYLGNDLESNSEHEDRRMKYILLGINWTRTVSVRKCDRQKGHSELHFRIAKSFWNEGDYSNARNHFLHSDKPEVFARFLTEYHTKCGYAEEKDLFIAQAVLQMLCIYKLKSSWILLTTYCDIHPDIRSKFPYPFPLLNFLHFTMLCLANTQPTCYKALIEQYESEIGRDPEYKSYINRIGEIYLGLQQPQTNKGGLLGSMIKGEYYFSKIV
ncbi:unnamed protein product [Thelazia callipaeda]|uniref:DOCKER domain-containing protein n=1 Tax=Thelazia callipaeda TaxID=103827 RepID=A0A0N5CXE5_THECL|nr:unnamed protein product [Thelazia callipaeda]